MQPEMVIIVLNGKDRSNRKRHILVRRQFHCFLSCVCLVCIIQAKLRTLFKVTCQTWVSHPTLAFGTIGTGHLPQIGNGIHRLDVGIIEREWDYRGEKFLDAGGLVGFLFACKKQCSLQFFGTGVKVGIQAKPITPFSIFFQIWVISLNDQIGILHNNHSFLFSLCHIYILDFYYFYTSPTSIKHF